MGRRSAIGPASLISFSSAGEVTRGAGQCAEDQQLPPSPTVTRKSSASARCALVESDSTAVPDCCMRLMQALHSLCDPRAFRFEDSTSHPPSSVGAATHTQVVALSPASVLSQLPPAFARLHKHIPPQRRRKDASAGPHPAGLRHDNNRFHLPSSTQSSNCSVSPVAPDRGANERRLAGRASCSLCGTYFTPTLESPESRNLLACRSAIVSGRLPLLLSFCAVALSSPLYHDHSSSSRLSLLMKYYCDTFKV